MKVRIAIMLAVLVVAVGLVAYAGCPPLIKCPMHNVDSRPTGRTKTTGGFQHQWAEYHCPGFEREPEHDFWVECNIPY